MLTQLEAPVTRREDIVDVLHGVEVADPYRWLEDQDSPETREWLRQQIGYTRNVLNSSDPDYRKTVIDRLNGMLRIDVESLPARRGNRYFFSRRRASEPQYIIYSRLGVDGTDEPIVDPLKIDPTGMTSAILLAISDDASLIAYGVRVGGADEIEVRFWRTDTGEDLPDRFPCGRYAGVAISADGLMVAYSVNLEEGYRVKLHRFGTSIDADVQVFGDGYGPEKIITCTTSDDSKWLIIHVYYGSSGTKTELYALDFTDSPSSEKVRTVVNDVDARFYAHCCAGTLYIRTDWNAPQGQAFKAKLCNTVSERSTWINIVSEVDGSILIDVVPIGGKLYLSYLQNISSRVVCTDLEGAHLCDVELPSVGTVYGPFGELDNSEAFYSFSSFATPTTHYRLDTATGDSTVWSRPDVPIDSSTIEVRQEFAVSADGTKVPMFLVHRKGLELDGERPVYITGYGGFNLSRTPNFSPLAAFWAEQDGIYVVINLRGGGEFGEKWHRAGNRENKQNVFDDLFACTQWLIDSGATHAGKIAVAGRSNGGLLTGAALTQRPDLYGTVICGYPLLDMIRYHQFLVASYWVPEYGSSEDAEQFQWLLSYSPYHNVKPGVCYPPTLFMTGDADTRVAPLHARKMTALIQAAQADAQCDNPVLLHYDTNAGHSDGKPIELTIQDLADELVFIHANLKSKGTVSGGAECPTG